MNLYLILFMVYIATAAGIVFTLVIKHRKRCETGWRRTLPAGAVVAAAWPLGWVVYGFVEADRGQMADGIYWVGGAFLVPVFYVLTLVAVTMAGAVISRCRCHA